jgi:hypothetical protein
MAKVHLDRLKEKYGWTGGSYTNLMREIVATETGNISRAIGRLSKDNFENAKNKMPKNRRQRFIVPDVSEVLPKRSVHVRKAAERGKLLTDELRDGLTKDLRDTMQQFTPKTGEQMMVVRRGEKAGRVNEKLVKDFQKRIEGTFAGYTKKDKTYGVPPNVQQIATTEVRSTVNQIKQSYMQRMLKKNPDIRAEKKWIHNTSLSQQPRENHLAMDGKTVEWNERFVLPNGVSMLHPHDPDAPASEVISCHCDYEIYLVVPRGGR